MMEAPDPTWRIWPQTQQQKRNGKSNEQREEKRATAGEREQQNEVKEKWYKQIIYTNWTQ